MCVFNRLRGINAHRQNTAYVVMQYVADCPFLATLPATVNIKMYIFPAVALGI